MKTPHPSTSVLSAFVSATFGKGRFGTSNRPRQTNSTLPGPFRLLLETTARFEPSDALCAATTAQAHANNGPRPFRLRGPRGCWRGHFEPASRDVDGVSV